MKGAFYRLGSTVWRYLLIRSVRVTCTDTSYHSIISSHDIFPSVINFFYYFCSVVMTMPNETVPNDQCLTNYAENVLFLLVPGVKINE